MTAGGGRYMDCRFISQVFGFIEIRQPYDKGWGDCDGAIRGAPTNDSVILRVISLNDFPE
jgi:hypothetical protein